MLVSCAKKSKPIKIPFAGLTHKEQRTTWWKMNEWKCEDFKCVWKPTESRLCLTHNAHVLDMGQHRTNSRGVTSRRCGLLLHYFGQLSRSCVTHTLPYTTACSPWMITFPGALTTTLFMSKLQKRLTFFMCLTNYQQLRVVKQSWGAFTIAKFSFRWPSKN